MASAGTPGGYTTLGALECGRAFPMQGTQRGGTKQSHTAAAAAAAATRTSFHPTEDGGVLYNKPLLLH